ncbi:hypothetical protein ACRRTK_015163 [Alexandromys fortis]
MASPWDEDILDKDFKILKPLGVGSFGEVKLACHIPTKTQVAVKILSKKSNALGEMNSEVKILQTLEHSNIIHFFHVIDTQSTTYIIMEYVAGKDLHMFLSEVGCLKEQEARPIFQQVVSAVHFLHRRRIAHRDIKLENILIDGDGNVKLCDFGLAIHFAKGQMLKKVCGSLHYMAPEMLARKPYDGLAVDMWSLGVVLYAMVTGHYPYAEDTLDDFTVPEEGVLMANVIKCATGDIGDNLNSVDSSPGDLSSSESTLDGRPKLFLNMDFSTEEPSLETNMPHNQLQIGSTTSASRSFKCWKQMRKRISHVLGELLNCVMPIPQ